MSQLGQRGQGFTPRKVYEIMNLVSGSSETSLRLPCLNTALPHLPVRSLSSENKHGTSVFDHSVSTFIWRARLLKWVGFFPCKHFNTNRSEEWKGCEQHQSQSSIVNISSVSNSQIQKALFLPASFARQTAAAVRVCCQCWILTLRNCWQAEAQCGSLPFAMVTDKEASPVFHIPHWAGLTSTKSC